VIGIICLLLSSVIIAAGFTRVLISNAGKFGFLDIPQQRSNHSIHAVPCPRGGGLSFVITFIAGTLVLLAGNILPLHLVKPLLTGGLLVAGIGFCDDRKGVSASYRLLVHFVAALLTTYWLTEGFQKDMNFSFMMTMPPWLQIIYSVLFIMWMVNLYNFMDGVDGMAGSQAIVVSLCSAALCLWQGNWELALLYGLIACGVTGFLFFNWAPAKIFMGDGGAYFLGFLFACLGLINKMFYGQSLIALMILMGTFIADATYTLLRRVARGEKVYVGHNKHAFQRAVQKGWSHGRVVTIYNLITACWLAPWAVLAVLYPLMSVGFLFIAYSPLLFGMMYLRAGSRHE
jgi:Fuc2NAc and GlcNAc transferase